MSEHVLFSMNPLLIQSAPPKKTKEMVKIIFCLTSTVEKSQSHFPKVFRAQESYKGSLEPPARKPTPQKQPTKGPRAEIADTANCRNLKSCHRLLSFGLLLESRGSYGSSIFFPGFLGYSEWFTPESPKQ